ncbi:hypothetical protein P691DRAFT_765650 [Macrolepiota fuliginosa MF-IS2]|uniref:Uncharacterized protein n=1 Tax=Macrolepiota fuliginosa MF-IS2 TaxID=1400762 RepID=A0A9P5WZJ0_9AGAR|nr:hypothetical protein P691DRAFT_765650 [Macrolepiota fuliginosa MF-IS2]
MHIFLKLLKAASINEEVNTKFGEQTISSFTFGYLVQYMSEAKMEQIRDYMNPDWIKLWLRELSKVQEWEEVPGQSSKSTSTPPPPWTDNSNINQFLQMAWTKASYSHIYTYGICHHSAFTMPLMLGQLVQYGWRQIAGTENYIHAYLYGNPLDTCTCLGLCHPDGRTISHHSPSSSSSKSKEPTNDHDNDHSSSSTSSSSDESSSDTSSSSSSSSSSDEQSNLSSSSSSASITNSSKGMGQLSYASDSVSE